MSSNPRIHFTSQKSLTFHPSPDSILHIPSDFAFHKLTDHIPQCAGWMEYTHTFLHNKKMKAIPSTLPETRMKEGNRKRKRDMWEKIWVDDKTALYTGKPSIATTELVPNHATILVTSLKDAMQAIALQITNPAVKAVLCTQPIYQTIRKTAVEYFDKEVVESSLQIWTPLQYMETKHLAGFDSVYPSSSGHSLGSCHWVVQSGCEKFVIIKESGIDPTRHPAPLDVASISHADMMLVMPYWRDPAIDILSHQISKLCTIVLSAINDRKNVFIPCHSSGLVLDIMSPLCQYLKDRGWEVPIYFLSPAANYVLKLADISSEWTSNYHLDRVLVGQPTFDHSEHQRLETYSDVRAFADKYSEPCVIIGGDPTIRIGAFAELMLAWTPADSGSRGTIILIEPELTEQQVMRAFPFSTFNVINLPMSASADYATDSLELYRMLAPAVVIEPKSEDRTVQVSERRKAAPVDHTLEYSVGQRYVPAFMEENISYLGDTKDLNVNRMINVGFLETPQGLELSVADMKHLPQKGNAKKKGAAKKG